MFEKIFPDGKKVIIENEVIALYDAKGEIITNSNLDYYFAPEGYHCASYEEAVEQYYENFGKQSPSQAPGGEIRRRSPRGGR